MSRPAAVRHAVAAGLVLAAITLVGATTAVFTLIDSGPRRLDTGELVVQWAGAVGMLAVLGLLIWGLVRLWSGRGRLPFLLACGAELAVCGFFLITMIGRLNYLEASGAEEVEKQLQATGIFFPFLIAVLPIVGVVRALGKATTGFLHQSTTD
jgi:hypothetical protein